ncbi:TolC family protein [Undibacterium sp. Jales W-56]|uniref:TolC family protein n=1 Tax=Undibacterium sp. Jales W-56 TaxID=2897325 RepID=UPI0021CED7D1|nr:TolC family protein [Undibacterium sp. Jales W-56]MCU6435291.1 TolC family protein [Undibacterium sp. Jales W-56]
MYKHLLTLGTVALLTSHTYALAGTASSPTIVPSSAEVSTDNSARPLTLEQAWHLAETNNPDLRREVARESSVRGEVADAHAILWNNPKLSSERIRRDVSGAAGAVETRREWNAGLEQTFEIAGQQGYRRQAADKELAALQATIAEIRIAIRYEVEQRFVQVLALQERIATETVSLKIIEDTAASIGKRVAAGEDSRLDGNLAKVEAVRAKNQIGLLGEQLIAARSDLATTIQLSPEVLPRAVGDLIAPGYNVDLANFQTNMRERPLFSALRNREDAARSRLALERASRYPDITVGISTGREGALAGRERLTSVTLSVPLPLFKRNAGNIGRAATELAQVRIEREAALRDSEGNVYAQWQKLQSLRERVQALQSAVLPALEENQRLSSKSLQAGEISLVQLLLVNRQLLEGRRDLIDAQSELRQTQIGLMRIAGKAGAVGAH